MIKKVYVYLVLFATLMMTIGGSVAVFMALADIAAPAPYYQSFEEFSRHNRLERPYTDSQVSEPEKLSETQLRELYNAMAMSHKQSQLERAKNSLVKSLGWIVVPLPVFIYFQRRLARDEARKAVQGEE
ncbi:MAG: hypothetical protein AB1796_15505 [Bacillota bacterium]